MGIRRVDDPQHPRGYREIRSNAEMRNLMDRKIVAQNGVCALCNVSVRLMPYRRQQMFMYMRYKA